jgi:hypothetical protein
VFPDVLQEATDSGRHPIPSRHAALLCVAPPHGAPADCEDVPLATCAPTLLRQAPSNGARDREGARGARRTRSRLHAHARPRHGRGELPRGGSRCGVAPLRRTRTRCAGRALRTVRPHLEVSSAAAAILRIGPTSSAPAVRKGRFVGAPRRSDYAMHVQGRMETRPGRTVAGHGEREGSAVAVSVLKFGRRTPAGSWAPNASRQLRVTAPRRDCLQKPMIGNCR